MDLTLTRTGDFLNYPIEFIILCLSVLLILGVIANNISSRYGVPALLISLAIGMLAGSDGVGGIYYDDSWSAQLVGTIALAVIMFAGGFDTKWNDTKPLLKSGVSLASLGVLLTALLTGGFCHWFMNLDWKTAMLLGAIVSSTDAAAVFSVLRARSIRLKAGLRPLLEFESGSNDPMAVMLVIGMIELIMNPAATTADIVSIFFKQMIIGLGAGWLMGRALVFLLRRWHFDFEGLYPILTLGMVLLIYGLTASLQGSGFLAVYVAGIILGNHHFPKKHMVGTFSDSVAWLMQILMFLVLGLLVFPSQLPDVVWAGLLLSLFLVFVARPAAVFASMAFSRRNVRQKLLISWTGLKGAVPIVLATFPMLAGVPHAQLLFNIVFFVVLVSVILQGTTIGLMAKWLRVRESDPGF